MEDNFKDYFSGSKKLFSEYLEARWKLFRLILTGKAANVFGVFLGMIIAAMLCFFVVLFLGFLLAFWISELTGSATIGFLITSLVFIAFLAIALVFRRQLIHRPLANAIIREVGREMDEEDEEEKREEKKGKDEDNYERYLTS